MKKTFIYISCFFLLGIAGMFISKPTYAATCNSVAGIFVQVGANSRPLEYGENVHCTANATSGHACTPQGRDSGSCDINYYNCFMPDGWPNAGFDCFLPYHVSCRLTSGPDSGQNVAVDNPNPQQQNGQLVTVNITLPDLPASPTPTNTPVPSNTPVPATPTPVPVTPIPACGPCYRDDQCQIQPNCGNKCDNVGGAPGNCYYAPPTPAPTSTPVGFCGMPCTPGDNRCVNLTGCNACINNVCAQAPTSTPVPAPQCHPGAVCTANGGECANGLCSNINPDTGYGICNCQGGGCVVGNTCSPNRGEPIPTPDANGQICEIVPVGGQMARCCLVANRNWEIDRCLPNTTATPVPATPTPVQPTAEVTLDPTPTVNPAVPTPTPQTGQNPQATLSQRWVCLDSKPCSVAGNCSGQGQPDHRASVQAKSDIKPLDGTDTYVFECIQVPDPNRPGFTMKKCTTGISGTDASTIGTDNLDYLQTHQEYRYNGMYKSNGIDPADNPVPDANNNNGNIGQYEWESYTHDNLDHTFFAMNWYDPNGPGVGNEFSQKQGTLPFDATGKKCIMIRWDPQGVVFDSKTSKPIAGAEVTLLKKTISGTFVPVTDNDVVGAGLQNPFVTKADGKFNFFVPDGEYKLSVKKDGYNFPVGLDVLNTNYEGTYSNLYIGQEISEKGKSEHYDVPMNPAGETNLLNLFESLVRFVTK